MHRGYSGVVNHALAYAAVHHQGQFRKGTRVPYLSHIANVALILARYGRGDDTIVPAILHDVVEDCKAHTCDEHSAAIERKFGAQILADVRTVTKPEKDAGGTKLTSQEKKAGYLEQIATGSSRAKWVCAADKLHNCSAILSDLARAESEAEVWGRFNQSKPETIAWYHRVFNTLRDSGFEEPIMQELAEAIDFLEKTAESVGGGVV